MFLRKTEEGAYQVIYHFVDFETLLVAGQLISREAASHIEESLLDEEEVD